MTLIEFSREMGRRPFHPFTLVLVDGGFTWIDPKPAEETKP